MDNAELKQKLLNGKKSERVIFAVTPELKKAIAEMAKHDCVTVSSLITTMLAEEAVRRAK